MNLPTAREAYAAARETAVAAYDAVIEAPTRRWARASADARKINVRIPAAEVDRWLTATQAAKRTYEDIVAGPRADVDAALQHERDTRA